MKVTLQTKKEDKAISTPNFMVLLFIGGYLLMDFLPGSKTIDKVSPQYLYLAVLNIIIGVYCYCNSGMLTQNLISVYKNSTVLKLYTAFLVLCLLSIITASNVALAWGSFSKLLIVFCMFLNLTILLHNRLHLLNKIAFLFGIAVVIQSCVILFDFSKSLDLGTIKGNTGNINILAASLNIKVPFLIFGFIHFSNWKKGLLLLALYLSTTIIFLTSSRATMLGLTIQLIVFLFFYIKIKTIKKAEVIKIGAIVAAVFFSFVTANLIFAKAGNSDRYKSVGDRLAQIELSDAPTDSSAKMRLDLWKNAGKISRQNPFFGVGIGNWKIESLPYEKTLVDDSNISSNTHNDFLELTAETGIINGLIYVILFLSIFGILIKKFLKSDKKDTEPIALLSLMLFFAYTLDAFFNFPLYIPDMQFGFCFLLALTLLNRKETVSVPEKTSVSKIAIVSAAVTIISLVSLYFAFSQFKGAQLEYKFKVYQGTYRANNNRLPERGRSLESNDIITNLSKIPSLSYYAEPFIEYAGVSLFYEGKYEEALRFFEQAEKINPYLGNSDWYIQKIEFNRGNIDKAYTYAKKAFYKRPRNKDFYLSVLLVANEKKDTLEMLKIHNLFTKYRKMNENWVNTSKALQLSGYSTKKIVSFLDEGLAAFPKDSLILERKASLVYAQRDNYLLKAQQYGKEQKFEKALEYYKNALAEDPNHSVTLQNIGVCYFKLNQYNKAIDYLLKIEKEAQLNDGKTAYLLGACYISIKNKEKGCEYLNIAKSKKYSGAGELIKKYCE